MTYVTLKDLAAELGLDRSTLRKYVIKHGLVPVTVRTPDSRSQETLALTPEDAEQVRALRGSQGYSGADAAAPNGWGHFYVVQLVPELAPQRVKLGWTVEMAGRLAAHRTAAPTAQLLKSWPCRKVWEYAAIDSVTRTGCRPLSNEVFDVDSLEALVTRGGQFFALMPEGRPSDARPSALREGPDDAFTREIWTAVGEHYWSHRPSEHPNRSMELAHTGKEGEHNADRPGDDNKPSDVV